MAPRGKRFTIFDAMEDKGVFEKNPANAGARDHEGKLLYLGPQAFPQMFYHPDGKEEVLVPAVAESTPFGPVWRNELRAIISTVAENEAQARDLRAAGWHDHPAKAIAAGNKLTPEAPRVVPAISSAQTIEDLERKVREMQSALELAQSNVALGAKPAELDLGGKLKAKVNASGLV